MGEFYPCVLYTIGGVQANSLGTFNYVFTIITYKFFSRLVHLYLPDDCSKK